MTTTWTPPTPGEELEILRNTRTVAMVGASTDPSRASYFVATYLLSSSSTFEHVWFVNPKGGEILGRQVYRSLDELPDAPDLVDVFRRAEDLPSVAKDVVAIDGTKVFWVQLGLHSDEAVEIAVAAGRKAVTNRCLKIEHARFRGGLHLAGFNTGVLSSRRRGDL